MDANNKCKLLLCVKQQFGRKLEPYAGNQTLASLQDVCEKRAGGTLGCLDTSSANTSKEFGGKFPTP